MATALYFLKHLDHIGPGWLLDRCNPRERPSQMVTVRSADDLPMAIECNGVVLVGRTLDPEAIAKKDPVLRAQVVFIRTLIALEVPYLGIDAGAQLLARAMLADLEDAPTDAVGFDAIPLTEAGRTDPVLGDESGQLPALRWPTHRFSLPRKATLLAGSDNAVEAFRFGKAAWGVLPHVELTVPAFNDWLKEPDAPAVDDATRADLLRGAHQHSDQMRQAAYSLMDRFQERATGFCHVPPPLAELHTGPDSH